MLYLIILDSKAMSKLDLVDNLDFINWSATYGGLEPEDDDLPFLVP